MTAEGERARLERECDVLARLLCGRLPSAMIRARYLEAHAQGVLRPPRGVGGFDRALVALARSGTLGARAADAHAAVLDRGGLLRHKVVLVLALLESAAPSEAWVDRPSAGSGAGFLVGAALRGGLSLVLLALGVIPLCALRAVCAVGAPRVAPAREGPRP